ncbi:MAG: MFS transporter [Anaerolineae bacterium]|nr:MFS transporter [Anaerolineae bacterium]
MQTSSRSSLITIIVAYIAFIGLGMAAGLLGLAWPSIQVQFNVPLDAVGILLFASTVGYLSASFFSGTVAFRLGVGRMMILGGAMMAAGLFLSAVVESWYLLIVFFLFTGLGSGTIDAGLNAYLAQHHGARAMNWLHACFGIGVTVSPLFMTAVLSASLSWGVGYIISAGWLVLVTALFAVTHSLWKDGIPQSDGKLAGGASVRSVLRMPIVWIGIVMFFLFAGLESTPGQWVYTLFTQARDIKEVSAGLWVSIYWGSFTIGRIFFGAIITRVNTLTLLRGCMVGVVVGALLVWWNPVEWIGFAGLTLLGFAQAPLFPVMISNTPRRVGAESAPNAIGFPVAGAGVGVAALPAFAGVLANNISLEIIPPFIFGASVLLIILHELSISMSARVLRRAAVPVGD